MDICSECRFKLCRCGKSTQRSIYHSKPDRKDTSEPLPFANIVVTNNNATVTGTVTDMDGNFTLTSDTETKAIKISYLGYITKDTIVSRSTFNTIMLAQDENLLDEVVVKAARKIFKMENGGISTDVAN
ncbi:carboxypeptidase-like regulatory domain-containing protein, partial [Bacteroides sp. OttesenSCG-928-N06]|nr:carboxypeptidase-like regulatory domain-containing protein [Bacteroides sp. OttesenSCG-928-N06]